MWQHKWQSWTHEGTESHTRCMIVGQWHQWQDEADLSVLASHVTQRHYYIHDEANKMADNWSMGRERDWAWGTSKKKKTERGRQWHLALDATWDAITQQHMRSHAHHPRHNGTIRSACHQPASSYCSVMYQSCCETEEEKDWQWVFLHAYCNISVWLPAHPSSKYLFRLSFQPPFSSLFDTTLLIMPLISHHASPTSHSLSL